MLNFPGGRGGVLTPAPPLLFKIDNIEFTVAGGGGADHISSSKSLNEQGRLHTEIKMLQWIMHNQH